MSSIEGNRLYGISLDKAYKFLKNRKPKTVVVAVIDSGVDTTQEDLKPILWHNREIPGNGIDDDHNGYVDDVYGWNFIGGKDGRNLCTRIHMKPQGYIGGCMINMEIVFRILPA